ncbi:hypothetical protein OEZ85_000187 [Tetradesmus obliquus]|uniref:Uncharacterized protein n=1 Tax=Tetradesmus obliquus TaxID=3088 RepID=A0ABY8USX8_TETOB|nr:hypothetical protein OEZ85_000187 [Tetradesmus obliquus]
MLTPSSVEQEEHRFDNLPLQSRCKKSVSLQALLLHSLSTLPCSFLLNTASHTSQLKQLRFPGEGNHWFQHTLASRGQDGSSRRPAGCSSNDS